MSIMSKGNGTLIFVFHFLNRSLLFLSSLCRLALVCPLLFLLYFIIGNMFIFISIWSAICWTILLLFPSNFLFHVNFGELIWLFLNNLNNATIKPLLVSVFRLFLCFSIHKNEWMKQTPKWLILGRWCDWGYNMNFYKYMGFAIYNMEGIKAVTHKRHAYL